MVARHGCVSMGYARFFGQVGWRERAGKKHFKNLLLPCLCVSAFARKKKQDSVVQETIHTETITSHPCKAMHLYQIIHVIWRESQSQETGV
jgi:hypothetical protein